MTESMFLQRIALLCGRLLRIPIGSGGGRNFVRNPKSYYKRKFSTRTRDAAAIVQFGWRQARPWRGPGMKIGGTGDITPCCGFTRTRVIDQRIWRMTATFTGSANLVVQRDKGPAGTPTWTSFGVRPVYALHDYFKLQFDVGHDRIKPAAGGPVRQLTKITLAPTLSKGKDFWSRPELRAFVTYARWNRAAQAAATHRIARYRAVACLAAAGSVDRLACRSKAGFRTGLFCHKFTKIVQLVGQFCINDCFCHK